MIGKQARDLTETVTGPALACLYTADRYHHLEDEIRPHLVAGEVVLLTSATEPPTKWPH